MEYTRLGDIEFKEHINTRVFITFMARDISVRMQKDNITKFISFNLVDKDKVVEAKLFGAKESVIEMIQEGKIYNAAVDVKPYDRSPSGYSCIIYNIDYSSEPAEGFVDWADNLDACQKVIENILPDIINTYYGAIAYPILAQKWSKFASWTAAKGQHHTRLGELLVHTSEVVQLCSDMADYFNDIYGESFINKPLLLAAAMIHDFEKINELNVNLNSGKTEYSTRATLSTHIMDILRDVDIQAYKLGLGEQKDVEDALNNDEELKTSEQLAEEQEAIDLLKHCLAAHHGKLEFGSPITPSVPEAYILNMMDNLSAEMYKYNRSFKDLEPGGSNSVWSSDGYKSTYKESSK